MNILAGFEAHIGLAFEEAYGEVDVDEAGCERHIRAGFRLIDGTECESRLAGYERRSRPGLRATHGTLSDGRADSLLAGFERYIRPRFRNGPLF